MKTDLKTYLCVATTPIVLIAVGGAAVARRPDSVSALAIAGLGLILGVIAALDYPLRFRCTQDGLERECLARRHLIPWNRVAAIEATRSTTLVVTTRGRRYLLAGTSRGRVADLDVPAGVALRS